MLDTNNIPDMEMEPQNIETPVPVLEIKQPKKRGRKPSGKRKGYFYEEEEQAFLDYVQSDNQSYRDRLFAEKLYPAFTKMIESIIRRYGLFTPDEDFEDTFYDTMSFMITKVNNFDATKGYKVYSYCGTVCKNYLLLKRLKAIKRIDSSIPYEQVFVDGKNEQVYNSDEDKTLFFNEIISDTLGNIKKILEDENPQRLTENERKVGIALVELLTNWDDIFDSLGSNKFNKTSVLFFIKENTFLTTKEVREAMKPYKAIYADVKKKLISE